MGRGRVSVYLSCFVLSATGFAIVWAPALLTAQAQTLVSEAIAFRAGLAFRAPTAPPLHSCLGEGQTYGDNDTARFDLVRCALPRSTDTPIATTPAPNAGSPTQAGPASAPQPGTVGATQPTTSVVSQPSSVTPPSTTHGNPPAVDLGFAYYPPGDLDPHDVNRGRKGDRKVYLPNIIFPLRLEPDQHPHMNSQIWGHGGSGWDGKGEPGGSECDPVNYDPMLQRDTYCEIRTWSMPMCPGGTGHQGQDIRPPTCKDNTWGVVAVVDGIITQVTSNTTVRLKGVDGTDYWYLHMHPQSITVKVGQSVKQGDMLGRISKYMDGDPNGTTMHLHFQVRQTIRVDGKILSVYVPGYTSLIAAYRKAKGLDAGIGPDGNLIADARFEIGAPKTPSSQPSPPVADQSAPSGPTAAPAAQQPSVPAPPSPAAGQSAPGGQPSPPPASSAAQRPPAPAASSPAVDQSAPSGQPQAAPQLPTTAAQAPTANQSAPGGQSSAPPTPATPLPAADQSAPSGQQSAPTASSASSQPTSPAATPPPDQSAPSGQPPAPTASSQSSQLTSPAVPSPPADQSTPGGQPPAPTASSTAPPSASAASSPPADQTAPGAQSPAPAASSAPQPPASTADQAASSAHPSPTSSPMAPQPPTTASVPQPPQSWWQRALSSAKEWWNKLGK